MSGEGLGTGRAFVEYPPRWAWCVGCDAERLVPEFLTIWMYAPDARDQLTWCPTCKEATAGQDWRGGRWESWARAYRRPRVDHDGC